MTETETGERFRVIHAGETAMTVCVPATMQPLAIEAAANLLHPIVTPWRISEDPFFAGGQPNPCACLQDAGRQHFLLCC